MNIPRCGDLTDRKWKKNGNKISVVERVTCLEKVSMMKVVGLLKEENMAQVIWKEKKGQNLRGGKHHYFWDFIAYSDSGQRSQYVNFFVLNGYSRMWF